METTAEQKVIHSLQKIQVDVVEGDRYLAQVGQGQGVEALIFNIIKYATGLLGVIALAVLIWAGFLYMVAAGNQNQITKAKKAALWAIIGLVVTATAFVVLQFIQDLFINSAPAATTTPSP